MVKTFHTCSDLFTPVHTCSHLFTPRWLSTLFAHWQFLVEFCSCESCFFFHPTCYLVEIAYFCLPNRELSNGVWLEKLYWNIKSRFLWQPILQWPCTLTAKCHFLHFQMLLFFSLMSYPAELHILTRLIKSFPTLYGLWSCIEIEMLIHLGALA